jgi:ribosomal 30S subunit maturation factor RimM
MLSRSNQRRLGFGIMVRDEVTIDVGQVIALLTNAGEDLIEVTRSQCAGLNSTHRTAR